MLSTIILIDFILFGFVLLLIIIGQFLRLYEKLKILLSMNQSAGSSIMDPSVEIPEEPAVLKQKYDVSSFRERMKKLKLDEDGLYTPPPEVSVRDFTGAEVISSDDEIEMERRRKF